MCVSADMELDDKYTAKSVVTQAAHTKKEHIESEDWMG